MSLPSSWYRVRRVVEQRLGRASRTDSDRPLDATLVVEAGQEAHIRISRLGHGTGVGWYAQNSLELSMSEARELARLLTEMPEEAPQQIELAAPISLDAYRARRGSRFA